VILIDTSIWIDHFRSSDPVLTSLVGWGQALGHPYVLGELAVGTLRNWNETTRLLRALPRPRVATESEFLAFIADEQLIGTGLGFVDVHLLAACRLSPRTQIWTRDKRLAAAAHAMRIAWIQSDRAPE
jgi:predicted nucleic acid-binding protein